MTAIAFCEPLATYSVFPPGSKQTAVGGCAEQIGRPVLRPDGGHNFARDGVEHAQMVAGRIAAHNMCTAG